MTFIPDAGNSNKSAVSVKVITARVAKQAKLMFSHACVTHSVQISVGVCPTGKADLPGKTEAHCQGRPTLSRQTPLPRQTPLQQPKQTPCQGKPPMSRQTPPPPPRQTPKGIQSMGGRYALLLNVGHG